MAKIRDRTEDFKDAARRAALNLGYDESKIAAIMASFIMHKSLERSSFTKAALTTLESIRALEQFLLKHKKDYVDAHRITEQERDSIEHEVLILSEKLHSVTSQFDQLLAVRFRDAINRVTPRRKLKQSRPSAAESSTSGNNSEVRNNVEAEAVRFQQQQLDDETRALQLELGSMLDAVQETETKMVEMSALNHLMSIPVCLKIPIFALIPPLKIF